LRKPRAILLLVKAGLAVDAVIEELLPYLEPGDLMIDGGNPHFLGTNRRTQSLREKGFIYLKMVICKGKMLSRCIYASEP
jgi:6-phosphogluconate dehydrogenase